MTNYNLLDARLKIVSAYIQAIHAGRKPSTKFARAVNIWAKLHAAMRKIEIFEAQFH